MFSYTISLSRRTFKYLVKQIKIMKKFTSLFVFIIASVFMGFSQVPDAFNYQAVVRNSSGELIADQNVSFRISILQDSESGTVAYSETHDAQSNSFGLVTLKVGQGNVVDGVFDPGGWGTAPHFLKIELDAEGGSSYTTMGTTQLLAVPYAFHAQTVEEDNVNDADADASNELQTISLNGTQLTLSNGGGTVTLPSSGETTGDNWGTQTVETDGTLTGNGTAASPLGVDGDITDNQTLSISGNSLSISGGNSVAIPLSPWSVNSDEIYYLGDKDLVLGESGIFAKTKSGEISIPPKFKISTENKYSLKLYNNSSTYGAFYVQNYNGVAAQLYGNSSNGAAIFTNNGTGPAASFRNYIKIADGTEGEGKVLTSDADGNTSWETPASGSSLWSEDGDHITYSAGNVAIGGADPADGIQLRVETSGTSQIAIRAANNSTGYGAFYAINSGTGPSAHFASHIKIQDGTQGDGKVLTSDGSGNASWQTPFGPIAYGTIDDDGTIFSSSGNISVSKTGTGKYEISISGESYFYQDYNCTATIINKEGFIRCTSSGGKLFVYTKDETTAAEDMMFNFVVYKY